MQTINFTKCKAQYTERDCSFMLSGDSGIFRDLSLLFCLATRGQLTLLRAVVLSVFFYYCYPACGSSITREDP